MYRFFLYQWQLGKADEEYLLKQVEEYKRITLEQYNTIISTPKIGG